jgi:hypothetical protein
MPRFVSNDPVDLSLDDVVSVESEIRAGSVVVFERRSLNQVAIRDLCSEQIRSYFRYQVHGRKGRSPR